jgi:hypothetical protein
MQLVRLRKLLLWVGSVVVLILAVWLIPQWQVESYNESLAVEEKIPPERLLSLENEYRKTVAQIIGGAVLLVGLYFTYRRIAAADRSVRISQEGQITERYTRAVDQDDGSKRLEVRLGGIYALERIARDSKEDHWTVLEVLAAYIRENASQESAQNSSEARVQPTRELTRPALLTLPLPSPDIHAALQVIRVNREKGDAICL